MCQRPVLPVEGVDQQPSQRPGRQCPLQGVRPPEHPAYLLRVGGHWSAIASITAPTRTYARPVLPVRRLGSDRYRRELEQVRSGELGTSFTADQQIGWSDYRLDREFREVPADRATAELFDVAPGTMLLERRFVFRSQGVPQQMSTSCLLLDMVVDTPVADPDREPWPGGNTAQLHSLGITITGVRERVRSRMPVREETEALRIPGGVPVVTITRQTYAGEQVVEVATDIVIPADRVELDYWIDLT
ncbi:UTRA domain-containing protein [Plantactinospora sp. KLBMP9567]|uniref:UTRA domain-containing protein n=1 Tax=Plantactinospora sp. KLBMP9567 TaxID=3085900 RepID=UPI00298108C7|nr:UTRA domain-containing protein [Plantactinospora sp. KLBMP9567]MDW5328647.1 UTRA domain-containing protein [Plantactinospora sp. KLBMP9567]